MPSAKTKELAFKRQEFETFSQFFKEKRRNASSPARKYAVSLREAGKNSAKTAFFAKSQEKLRQKRGFLRESEKVIGVCKKKAEIVEFCAGKRAVFAEMREVVAEKSRNVVKLSGFSRKVAEFSEMLRLNRRVCEKLLQFCRELLEFCKGFNENLRICSGKYARELRTAGKSAKKLRKSCFF